MDDLFRKIEVIKLQYRDGLVDKTDALAQIANCVNRAVVDNSVVNRNKVAEITKETGALDKIRKIVTS